MAKSVEKAVLLRLSAAMLKKLDGEAKAQQRSRTAEIRFRLMESLKRDKQERVVS